MELVIKESFMVIVNKGGSIVEMRRSFEKLSDVEEVFSTVETYEHSESESKIIRKAYIDTLRNLHQWLEEQSVMDDHSQAGIERHESTKPSPHVDRRRGPNAAIRNPEARRGTRAPAYRRGQAICRLARRIVVRPRTTQ